MCLLAVLFRAHPTIPLVVAANRDEWRRRPAGPMQPLREREPRILGGRDELAGGTWLAVNEHGVVAGLTNKPLPSGPDASKRSRGELPLRLTAHRTASEAAIRLAREVRTTEYNPCWLLTGDRDQLFYIDMTTPERPGLLELEPGVHVLENRALAPVSAKAAWVADRLRAAATWQPERLVRELEAMLASHTVPPETGGRTDAWRPLETEAACVHAGPYGTRSSSIVLVPADAAPPRVLFAPGPPCTTAFSDVSELWTSPS